MHFKNEKWIQLGKVRGDVFIEDCDVLVPQKGKEIVVKGTLIVEGSLIIEGSLSCKHLRIKSDDKVIIQGDLKVDGSVIVKERHRHSSGPKGLKVTGSAVAHDFDIDGSLHVGGDLDSKTVKCGGSLKIERRIRAERLSVGGSASCVYGIISRVDVGGSFKASGTVEIGDLDVGGTVVVGQGSKIISINVGGTFKSLGEITFKSLDVGGSVKLEGDAAGESIEVGGVLKVSGSLILSRRLDVGGIASIHGDLRVGEEIHVGGILRVGGQIDCPRVSDAGHFTRIHTASSSSW